VFLFASREVGVVLLQRQNAPIAQLFDPAGGGRQAQKVCAIPLEMQAKTVGVLGSGFRPPAGRTPIAQIV
jgi:hypothetical protein